MSVTAVMLPARVRTVREVEFVTPVGEPAHRMDALPAGMFRSSVVTAFIIWGRGGGVYDLDHMRVHLAG